MIIKFKFSWFWNWCNATINWKPESKSSRSFLTKLKLFWPIPNKGGIDVKTKFSALLPKQFFSIFFFSHSLPLETFLTDSMVYWRTRWECQTYQENFHRFHSKMQLSITGNTASKILKRWREKLFTVCKIFMKWKVMWNLCAGCEYCIHTMTCGINPYSEAEKLTRFSFIPSIFISCEFSIVSKSAEYCLH